MAPRKRKQTAAPPSLHDLEAEVMQEIWRQGEATVRAVMDALNARAPKERAYTTYMTVLARLDRKGLLARRRERGADVYSPVMDRDSYMARRAESEIEGLLSEFGDVALAHFAKHVSALDAKRLRELKRLAGND